jgi:hypothetical protein
VAAPGKAGETLDRFECSQNDLSKLSAAVIPFPMVFATLEARTELH